MVRQLYHLNVIEAYTGMIAKKHTDEVEKGQVHLLVDVAVG